MEIQTGGGVLGLGNPDGRGGLAVLEIRVEWGGGGGSKKHAICRGCVDFFWNNPMGKKVHIFEKKFLGFWAHKIIVSL